MVLVRFREEKDNFFFMVIISLFLLIAIKSRQQIKPLVKKFLMFLYYNISGFLTNEWRVAIYGITCITWLYCTNYELHVTCELRITIYFTSYVFLFAYELRVTIYCLTCNCNVDCIKLLYYISMDCSLQNQVFLTGCSWVMCFINECSNIKL